MKRLSVIAIFLLTTFLASAQQQKVYDETINPIEQIETALLKAKAENKYVVCQVGGNWCRWCLMFAKYIKDDEEISKLIDDNFVYIHVNYPRRAASSELNQRLGNISRFGFPVFVVLGQDGSVLHIQDSSFLEEGEGYNKTKVLRFFKCWTPQALDSKQ